jgi:hydrogenase maturation protease
VTVVGGTAVVGLGNVLLGDDAAGPHVIARLQAGYEFPPQVEVLDLGTPGLDLVPFVADLETLIVVDTVRAEGPPGSVRVYDREEVLAAPVTSRVGPHDPGLKEAVLATEFARQTPLDVTVVGVVPAHTGQRIGLGTRVQQALPALERAVLDALLQRGHRVRPRSDAHEPDLWWEARAATDPQRP